jgi:hypothetical protein
MIASIGRMPLASLCSGIATTVASAIYPGTAPARVSRLRRARLNFPAANNRARDELPDQR